jgi:hypothetical protein
VQLGDEVGAGDIDEGAGGERKQQSLDGVDRKERERRSHPRHRRQPANEIKQQRPAGREAGVDQDPEVSQLLRDLVQCHGYGGGEPYAGGRNERARHNGTVEEVVESVAHEIRHRYGMQHLLMGKV